MNANLLFMRSAISNLQERRHAIQLGHQQKRYIFLCVSNESDHRQQLSNPREKTIAAVALSCAEINNPTKTVGYVRRAMFSEIRKSYLSINTNLSAAG